MKRIYEARRKNVVRLFKISVVVLAVMILITAVAAIVTLATGGFETVPAGVDMGVSKETDPPSITGPEGNLAVAYIGEAIAYKSFVTVSGGEGEVSLSVNNQAVKTDVAGSYRVVYTATDAAGNTDKYTLTLILRKRTVSDADLEKLEADIAAQALKLGITSGMSKEEQVRKVYSFVNGWVRWGSDRSNIEETQGASFSRDTWQVDWQEEAILALKNKSGDCYSYYALSKAFFEYLGIENLGIRRSKTSKEAGTHFWHIVNIGTKDAPQWYYYDATELGGTFSDNTDEACLLTENELNSYVTSDNRVDNEFYKLDKKEWEAEMKQSFPKIATKPLP